MEEEIKLNNNDNFTFFKKDNFNTKFLLKNLIFVSIIVFVFLKLFLSPPGDFGKNTIFTIGNGAGLRNVSYNLKENNFIRSRVAFETLVILFGGEKHIIPGSYFFEKKLGVYEIARRISEGDKQLASLKITIPEGFNNQEIALTVSKKLPFFNKEEFLILAKDSEGYIFPDTYFFSIDANEKEVFDYMSKNFEKKFKDIRIEIEKLGKNEKEILTMASILEREARGDIDREYVSGILWKRLNIGMALQVDAWPATYKEKGLPNHPISNPGLEAIHAALYPKTTPYLYYLHDKEGMIHYARSFAEHKANIAKYLR